ncbi:MAG: hypothetical protein J6S98_07015 [Lentisphaeria bacterium]|nr:hypothetical protein [Lentisphaeria bacterium]
MDQGFQEKLDLLERQFTSANRAFSKGDYSATVKFLQEAEASGVALQTFCSPLKKNPDFFENVIKADAKCPLAGDILSPNSKKCCNQQEYINGNLEDR